MKAHIDSWLHLLLKKYFRFQIYIAQYIGLVYNILSDGIHRL